ncbi:bifunctional riboflavin kinase/FAD synthetase [Planctomyces sp. SH-PL62]|uniref:bifunctional riboflavin kinase/FAD synthetase n=1 Tax=Planctomyces sp. SH-PL62 TaxID=1636152 RepID=UPI00078E96E2|nr:bifunctional riboflavin kinase/FAD synthetase [Planctomyces sp. SH-PL62]AMV36646.1 Riboflavin biosynthesis protein RibF [Planctomyces sp. SH-PL62]
MITIENVRDFPARARGAYVTIGNFDGVHRGHARLMAELVRRADAAGAPALAVTFDPHPAALLRPEQTPEPLVRMDREIELLMATGVSDVAVFRTGPWLLGLSAREFFEQVVLGQFAARGMVEGPNFFFGRDRQGNVDVLGRWCRESGVALHVAEPLMTDDGRMISSSRIRRCLVDGQVAEARDLLGRPHRIRGLVTHGAGRGAGIGVPTANLDEIDVLIPAPGVYAATVLVPGVEPGSPPSRWPAACNIGPNPTFGEQQFKVEAHLIDFRGDLYGQLIELEFLERLRPTRAFAGLDDLLQQISRDVEQARRIAAAE